MSTCIVTRSGSPPKAAIWSWTHCKASSWVGIGQFYKMADDFSPGPWVQRFQQSDRQEDRGSQEVPLCIARRPAPVRLVWTLKVFGQKWRLYHVTLQELPGSSPNVSSQHERPTVDVNLLERQLIALSLKVWYSFIGCSYLTSIYH